MDVGKNGHMVDIESRNLVAVDPLNEPCAVCNDKSTGVHYGVQRSVLKFLGD